MLPLASTVESMLFWEGFVWVLGGLLVAGLALWLFAALVCKGK